MKLVVGLGNPGPRYRGTRHNIGFAVLDEVARRAGVLFESGPVEALIARIRPIAADAEPALLAKPMTFMNASAKRLADSAEFKAQSPDLWGSSTRCNCRLRGSWHLPRGPLGGPTA